MISAYKHIFDMSNIFILWKRDKRE